jgi:putative toxin-antitoxin system antitoxin component (TIGR02293 family)
MGKTYKSTRTSNTYNQVAVKQLNYLEEPASSYFAPQNTVQSILNLVSNFQNEMDYVILSRNGILKNAVNNMAHKFGITQEKICQLLHMSARNFQRIKEDAPLDIYTSEQTIEMAKIYAKASEIFADDEATKQWFKTPNYALGNQTPIDLLDTSFGVKMVNDVLGRIEHGVYS